MTKRLKILLAILVVVILIALAYVAFWGTAHAPVPGEEVATTTMTGGPTGGSAKPTTNYPYKPVKTPATGTAGGTTAGTGTTAPAPLPPVPTLQWHLSLQGTSNPNAQPSTAVTLQTDNHNYTVGTFIGTCKTVAEADIKTANEVSAVRCLIDGKGTEIGVFRAGNKFAVEKADFQTGEAGHPDVKGVFSVLLMLDQG